MNDNRSYQFDPSGQNTSERPEYSVIAKVIPRTASVIDLGAGDGSLLQYLKKQGHRGVLEGVERSPSGVKSIFSRGFQAHQREIDSAMPQFAEKQFDVAVCNVTIQMVMYPEILVQEARRISRHQIYTFPNFAYLKNRVDLLVKGRMPRWGLFGYQWFSTGHIHQLSVKDFYQLAQVAGVNVKSLTCVDQLGPRWLARLWPNLLAKTVLMQVEDK